MAADDTADWTPWVAGSYGLYGPFLSPLEAYRAEREAESLDRIRERLDAARQAREAQRQAIRESLQRARQARQAELDQLREAVRRATADAPAETGAPSSSRGRPARRNRTTPPVVAGVSERLDEPDEPGLWSVDELLPAEGRRTGRRLRAPRKAG